MAARIMVVDDEDAIREVIADILRDAGYAVVTARHGADALHVLDHDDSDGGGIQAILLDMRMPVMDGWKFARAYRQRPGPHAPLIVMTAAQHAEQWCQEVLGAACLPKPFDVDAVLACVAEQVHQASA